MIAPRRSHWCEVPAQPTVIVMSYGQIFDMLAAIAKRRAEILAAYRNLTPEQRTNVIDELAELSDPRTAEQIDLDNWAADWHATNEANRPQ